MELRNFFKKKEIKDTAKNNRDFEKKNNKFLKVFGCLALATFMTATALFATAPFGTDAASAATNTNLSNTSQTTSPLGLDPENDPVLFKTSSGLEIKFGGATLESGGLAGYAYFQMGTYNSNPVNWVIIGYGGTVNFETPYLLHNMAAWYDYNGGNSFMDYLLTSSGPAGTAIYENSKYQDLLQSIFATATNAIQNSTELEDGEFLCLSEKLCGSTEFNSGSSTSYAGSLLKTYMNTLYETTLGLNPDQKALIEAQTLKSMDYEGVMSTTTENYLFPLATTYRVTTQEFSIETYLNSSALRACSGRYWTRCGAYNCNYVMVQMVYETGVIAGYASYPYKPWGVRPAMVIKL